VVKQALQNGSYLHRYKAYLSLCYRLGIENLKVTGNPVRLIRPHQEDNARTRFLTHAEFAKLLEIVRRDHPAQAPSLIVAAYSAMRWSEQFGITWSQVDFKRMKIVGVKTKSTRKSKVRRRDVPLNSVSAAALKQQQILDGNHIGPKDIVFPKPGPYADWDWWLKPALAEAKIEDLVWHSLRHTCLSWAAMSGATMREIQELGGHLTIPRPLVTCTSLQPTPATLLHEWPGGSPRALKAKQPPKQPPRKMTIQTFVSDGRLISFFSVG